MPRRLAVLAVVLAMVSASAVVATTASAAGTGGIAGVVTGPGGVPIEGAGAGVYLQPGNIIEVGWAARTDATGAYAIPNLPAGDYKVLFGFTSTSPYTPEWYDDAPDEASADLVHVADGTVTTGIDVELAVGARISGRLTTPTGNPVSPGVGWAHRLVDELDPAINGVGFTDADGFYVVEGLPPGTYRLEFRDGDAQHVEFWNDKASFDMADDIVLTEGQVRTGFDAVLDMTPPPPPPPPPDPPPAPLPVIVNTALPMVEGAAEAPQVGYPLTVSQGNWTPGGVAVTVQWLVNGQPIPSATGTSYTPTLSDLGKTLAARATASLPGYTSATATSLPTNAVSKQVQNIISPRLKGTSKVGERLRVKPGVWRPLGAVTFRYRWYADGQRIRGARDPRLRLTSAMKGTKIVCRVTGSAPGLDPVQVKTRASAKVKQ